MQGRAGWLAAGRYHGGGGAGAGLRDSEAGDRPPAGRTFNRKVSLCFRVTVSVAVRQQGLDVVGSATRECSVSGSKAERWWA